MLFGGSTKNTLINRFQLRSTKNATTSILTASFDSDEEDSYDSTKVELITPDGRGGVYNFDDLRYQLNEPRSTRRMTLLPIPLPCIEPTTTQDIDEITKDNSSPQCSSSVRFRWSSIRSQFSSDDVVDQENVVDDSDDTLKTFFSCGTQSTIIPPMMTDTQYNSSVEGYECSDDTSLLHGRTVHKASRFFRTSINTCSPYESNTMPTTPTSSKRSKHSTTKIEKEEQYTSLLANKKDICYDWMHGQLAFDLEYVEQSIDTTNPTLGDSNFAIEEAPNWALHPDDIGFETPPPPPLTPSILRYNKSRKKSRKKNNDRFVSDESFMKLLDGYESTDFLDKLIKSTSHCEPSSTNENVDMQQVSWQDFDAEMITGYVSRNIQSYRKISPIVRPRHGRYGTITHEIQRRGRSSRHGRRRSGRHSPPKLLGRQFATNLSTVTERPSEEEATSSCIPTPMSNKNRRFFTAYESDTSSNESGEGTAETCSSKDSSS